MPLESKVLIVDDEPVSRDTLTALLHREGYRLIFARDGAEALEKAARHEPDVILLDVMMPGMDGFEVCRRLRASDRLADVPVVVVTALDDRESRLAGIEAGADDFLSKPFDRHELRARVKVIAGLNRYRRMAAEREKAAKAAREGETLYRTLTESVADGVLLVQEEKVKYANRAFLDLFDYPETTRLAGIGAAGLFGGDCQTHFKSAFNPASGAQAARPATRGRCRTQTGRDIWISASYNSTTWRGKPAVLVTVRDITEDAVREMELLEQSERLQKECLDLKSSIKERYKFRNIVGKSPLMQDVYTAILQAADTDANVLILGETGTGKELVARAIHDLSDRAEKAFVTVTCGAVPENLVESEFFGHKKGAFTDARADKQGYLHAANGGTLFLDEVGELNLNIQVKLLRAIEYGEYVKLGSTAGNRADIRIISATNRDLAGMAVQGLVREDFYYRIRVVPVQLPPLRDRREDIPLLVEHFLKMHARGKTPPTISGNMLDMLGNHTWPGNVRELQSVILRYLATGNLDCLPVEGRSDTSENGDRGPSPAIRDLRGAMGRYEKRLLSDALDQHQWQRAKTAAALNIGQRTLYTKMKKFGLI